MLLRASGPSEETNELLEEVDAVLSRAEKQMHALKSTIASECKHIKQVEEIFSVSEMQAAQVEHIKKGMGQRGRKALAELLAQRGEEANAGEENEAPRKSALKRSGKVKA